jgi:hypothetical protein
MLFISQNKNSQLFCLNGENNQIVVYLLPMLARCHFAIVNFDVSMFKRAHVIFFHWSLIFLELTNIRNI